jgi:hypothetical protein
VPDFPRSFANAKGFEDMLMLVVAAMDAACIGGMRLRCMYPVNRLVS